MTQKKEQKIIVLVNFSASDNAVILNGIKIATIFKKELCLVYNYNKRERKQKQKFKEMLYNYTVPIQKELENLRISTLLLSETKSDLSERLSDEFEGIFVVAHQSEYSKLSKSLSASPIPFLFIKATNTSAQEYKKLIFPVDLRKEASEGAIWSSYFGRFNKSEIAIIAANDKGKEENKQVTKNVVLSKKLFLKFNIKHKIYKGTKSSLRNAFEALNLAHSSNGDLLVILGSTTITPLDLLIGLPERKIIKMAGQLPVLVINPRRDNYVLCD